MFILGKGKYTGKVANSLNVDGSVISSTFYSAEESNCDWHCHENLHISFVFEGGESETRSSSPNKLGDGGIFFYHAGEKHRWISPKPVSKSINIEIGVEFFNRYEFSEFHVDRALNNTLDSKLLMLKIQREMLADDSDSFTTIQTLLLELVSFSKTLYEGSTPKWVSSLSDLLNDRWNERVTLKELSRATEVHPVTISKYFRKYFSCTLGEYLRKLKIDRSISLIKNTDKPLTEIAFCCGFADQSHFTRTFRHLTGFSPREFRNI